MRRDLARICGLLAVLLTSLFSLASCGSTPPAPVPVSLAQVQMKLGRGGRAVAVTVSPTNRDLAIAASESGGLFRTKDGGASWQHVDAFSPFRVQDVAFAKAISSNPRLVIATTTGDANRQGHNHRGIWFSPDDGDSWFQAVLSPGCSLYGNAHGITFVGTNWIFVATDCGILASPSLGATWNDVSPFSAVAVAAQMAGTTVILDACTSDGHRRSTDAGQHWSALHSGPACQSPHGIAVSPFENNVVFATAPGGTLLESDDAGVTWVDLHASAFNERPVWVATQAQDPTHFALYFPGRRVICSGPANVQRCADGKTWDFVPALQPLSAPNHDINGIALDPRGSCPVFMAADAGVFLRGAPTGAHLCGEDSNWSVPGSDASGFNALQIYDVAGSVHLQDSSSRTGAPAFTDLFIGTQDNLVWATHDVNLPKPWHGIGVEGSYLQANPMLPAAPGPGDEQVTFVEFGSHPASAHRSSYDAVNESWIVDSDPRGIWTTADLPGNGTAPFFVAPHTFVQWNAGNLFLSQDNGGTWTLLTEVPANTADASLGIVINAFGSVQLTRTPSGPAVYEYVADKMGRTGLALQQDLAPPNVPGRMDLRTFAGRNRQGQNSGLQSIGGNCFGAGAWYCRPVYAPDPSNFLNVIAADSAQGAVMISHDAGLTWSSLDVLTALVTEGGTLSFKDGLGGCQVHVIAYDPANPKHILVGTDEAGIMASANGGDTWAPLLDTSRLTAISNIFFDANSGAAFVATYGRGLWRLILDWSAVPK